MSFWGVTVITNLFSSLDGIIPGLGTAIVQWLWGGYSVSGTTLNRFFSLHYLLPFILVGLVILHIWALHVVGQNNPTGLDIKTHSDAVPMTPHAVAKDAVGMAAFFVLLAWFVFFLPDYLGHSDNYIEANPLVTPAHIVPEWYFLPFYAILRAIPSKLGGVIAMFASVLILAFVPWLDTSRVRSSKYRPVYKWFFWLFAISCLALGYLGAKPAEGVYVFWARIFTAYYFLPLPGGDADPGRDGDADRHAALDHGGRPRQARRARAAGTCCPGAGKGQGEGNTMISKALKPLRAAALVALAAASPPSRAWPRPRTARDDPAPEVDLRRHFRAVRRSPVQRGFQVYQEVCSACHGLNRVAFRNLVERGGPQFPEEAVKELARNWPNKVLDGPNDEGKMFEREPRLSDPVLGPYRNEKEARAAQNGALPPDLSLIAKARSLEPTAPWYIHPFLMLRDVAVAYQEGGADYTYALLDGYEPPPGFTPEGMSYNAAFPGHQIAMAPPLSKDRFVTYQDGSGSPEQNMKDVTAFLARAGDPSLEARKHMGWQVILYLLITTGLLYVAKKRLWSRLH